MRSRAARQPLVYARIDPDHGDRATPLFDAGATARFVLRYWDRVAARDAAAAEIGAGRTAPIVRFAGAVASDPARDGIADAYRVASPAVLATQRAAVADALAQGRRVDALGLILAERLADAVLFGLVFDYADEPVALAAIPSVARTLDDAAAVLEIGRLAEGDAAARQFLFESVVEPDIGPSAATALARLGDPSVSADIGRRLSSTDDEPTRHRLVLALKLDASPAARDELAHFVKTGAGSAPLQKEVRQWLER